VYSFSDLLKGFQAIPLTTGRAIMVHSSYKSLGGVAGGAETVIDALLEWVGNEGTVLLPTFNFVSWSENHYFDIAETPSHMGIIGELARKRPQAVRTPHPMYPFAALGEQKDEFGACDDIEAFGPNSVFACFHKLNGIIVSIGLHWNHTFTIHHYVEYRTGCAYRRVKHFAGTYIGYDRVPRLKTYSMFVRKDERVVTDIAAGMGELHASGVIGTTRVGDAIAHYASAEDFFENMSVIVRQHPEKLHRIKQPTF